MRAHVSVFGHKGIEDFAFFAERHMLDFHGHDLVRPHKIPLRVPVPGRLRDGEGHERLAHGGELGAEIAQDGLRERHLGKDIALQIADDPHPPGRRIDFDGAQPRADHLGDTGNPANWKQVLLRIIAFKYLGSGSSASDGGT